MKICWLFSTFQSLDENQDPVQKMESVLFLSASLTGPAQILYNFAAMRMINACFFGMYSQCPIHY